MKTEPLQTKPMGIGGLIVFVLAALVIFALLELGKNTLLGWGLAILALAGYVFLRNRVLVSSGGFLRFLAFVGLIALLAGIFVVSAPPVKRVPAVQGENGGVTGIIHTEKGDVQGVYTADQKVEVYTGIPYAKPPVGDLRWKEPVPADPWEGVLLADHFAPMSMQTTNSPLYSSLAQIIGYHDYQISLDDNYVAPVSEDSLYLNIWKPAGDVKNLPVLVYVHGGSLQTGQPWYADYSGEGLARDGMVVVNMHYRLGIFGFFADEELAAESGNHTTGNYGLLDQILALTWVRDNIAAFGGDPDNVTLAGESAGSACVSALCTSPLAGGLFRRVLMESSTVSSPEPAHSFRSLEDAFAAAERTKAAFGAATIADLRAIPAEDLAGELSRHHHITVDGYVLPELPYESYAKGIHNEEVQLQGFNREESGPFILFGQASLSTYEDMVRGAFEAPYADRVLALFPATTDEEARQSWADIYTAVLFSYGHYCLERQAIANSIPVYPYFFTKENGRLGSWHSGEEVYFYHNIPDGSKLYTDADRALSDTIAAYVKNYCTTGNPNGDGLPAWEASLAPGTVQELGERVGKTTAPFLELYEVLDEMYGFEG
ncbi:MAG: carboxylesterase family protein [Lachnospiraceae bacterium]|nr:carboxylesterase family protein [Lachnospiraceae bacterium]